KDDLDALKILKIDVLALGMLTCIRKGLNLVAAHHGVRHTLASIPQDDKEVYDMLSRGDSLGVFQVESRAQMSMLPRLRPRCFYDLVIQVAIVRPGPIQGDMVHPYLRRRDGLEPVVYPSAELEAVLERTLGVPLFQEQAMSIAIVAAGFSADDADRLRRAMATFRHTGKVSGFHDRMIEGMVGNGYERDFAERCFKQIEGFGEYGFPESHAASFASLVYVSSWIKRHHPAAFACALLNSQPMGFYAPAQIVRDAREHGVVVLPPDVNRSDWDNTLEDGGGGRGPALRLGLRQIAGASEDEMTRLAARRGGGYRDVADVWRRGGLSRRQIEILARADAFASLDLSPRDALWASRGLRDERLPLFDAPPAAMDRAPEDGPSGRGSPVIPSAARDLEAAERSLAALGMTKRNVGMMERKFGVTDRKGVPTPSGRAPGAAGVEPAVALPGLTLGERIVDDYASLRLSLRGHPLSLLRGELSRRGVGRNDALATLPVNKRVSVSGLVLVRQRPGSAKGVVFATIEDESGIANAIVWPAVFDAFRRVVMTARLLRVDGRLQRESGVIHVVAERLVDLAFLLDRVADLDGAGGDGRRLAPPNAAQGLRHRARDIVIPLSRADAAKHGAAGSRDGEYREPPPAPAARPAAGAAIPVRSRDFH
ncbi:MAG: error-prone DNA polymerase, partial [Rhodospirillales bacterium]|nr:error-prone DNA polymerase [Rhodospirillales bacterium]